METQYQENVCPLIIMVAVMMVVVWLWFDFYLFISVGHSIASAKSNYTEPI